MGRVEDYLGDRLRGRDIPDDLRRLVELELDGVLRGPDSVQPFAEVRVLAPGERHALESQEYRPDDDADTLANGRAIDEVLAHTAVVVDGFNGDLFGYWLHRDEGPNSGPTTWRGVPNSPEHGQTARVPRSARLEVWAAHPFRAPDIMPRT